MTVVSGNIRSMRIFAGVPWRRGVKRYRKRRFSVLMLRLRLVVSRDQQRRAEADRDPQNILDSRKDCASFVDEKLRALRRRNLNK